MRLRFTIAGYEVWALEFDREEAAQEPSGITGGTSLYTERDMNPPTNEEPWYEDRFGFG